MVPLGRPESVRSFAQPTRLAHESTPRARNDLATHRERCGLVRSSSDNRPCAETTHEARFAGLSFLTVGLVKCYLFRRACEADRTSRRLNRIRSGGFGVLPYHARFFRGGSVVIMATIACGRPVRNCLPALRARAAFGRSRFELGKRFRTTSSRRKFIVGCYLRSIPVLRRNQTAAQIGGLRFIYAAFPLVNRSGGRNEVTMTRELSPSSREGQTSPVPE
jgi:hypothetical protein